jgi:hypothetical protein
VTVTDREWRCMKCGAYSSTRRSRCYACGWYRATLPVVLGIAFAIAVVLWALH